MSHWWASQVAEMTQEQQRSSRILKIYGALISSSLVANFICSYLLYWTLLKASERLHNKMVVSVIKAPLNYFDKTPVGRTLNRFSKDIGSMDDVLTPQFLTAVETVLFATSTILLPVVANIWLIFIAVPLVLVAFYYGRYYLKSSREIKRLEAITCSPVYSHISDSCRIRDNPFGTNGAGFPKETIQVRNIIIAHVQAVELNSCFISHPTTRAKIILKRLVPVRETLIYSHKSTQFGKQLLLK